MKKLNVNYHKKAASDFKLQVFLKIMIILFVIIFGILISSSSFYIGMIQSIYTSTLKSSIKDLENGNPFDPDTITNIENIENKHFVMIEIYGKENADSKFYTTRLYSKCVHDSYYCKKIHGEKFKNSKPMVDYINNKFTVMREYPDGSKIGILDNRFYDYKFFTMVMPSQNGNYLLVSSVRYANIEDQARSISISSAILCLFIYVGSSLAIFMYLSRVINPLKSIVTITHEMSVTNKKSLQIPNQHRVLFNDVDMVINSINTMYQSLILTKEELEEKTMYLSNKVIELDEEQKFREEFIANISHELKTPISIIQGYAECIEYLSEDKESSDEYCKTIIDECSRLRDLVVDMISLSDIRRNANILKLKEFSITTFIKNNLALHQRLFANNNIRIENKITDQITGYGDVSKISFVINNLLSNAISYIGGEKQVIRLRYEDAGLAYRIFVFNSGNGLDDETLEKMWQSFYRTDESRSRTDGHFGLGLSIVKAVQDSHSQQCGVQNADGGIEFWFDISKDNFRK